MILKKQLFILLALMSFNFSYVRAEQPIRQNKIGVNFWNRAWADDEKPWQAGANMATGSGASFWNPVFIEQLSRFEYARFMDWGETNGSNLSSWTSRPSKTSTNPIAYEHWIDLCNTANVSLWVCIPAKVINSTSDGLNDFVRKLAILIKTGVDMKAVNLNTLGDLSTKTTAQFEAAGGTKVCNPLNSNLKVYVEYSNETWNLQFSQNSYCLSEGDKLGLKVLNSSGTAANRFSAWASFKVFDAFATVYSPASMGTTVKRVIAAQAENDWLTLNVFLPSFKDPIINPKSIPVDAYSISNYYCKLPNAVNDPTSGDLLVEAARIERAIPMLIAPDLALLGIPLVAYEGGVHWNAPAALDTQPVMYTATRTLLHAVNPYFDVASQYTLTDGQWGLLRSTDQSLADAHKYRAVVHYLDTLANHYVPDVTPPLAPNGVHLSKVSCNDMTFEIYPTTDNRFLKFYKIYLNGTVVLYKNYNDLKVHLKGLSPSTSYTIKITAVDAEGNESAPCQFVKSTRELLPDLYVLKLNQEITIDGAPDAIWNSVVPVVFNKIIINKQADYTVTPSDLSGTFRMAYTTNKLYFMAEINDDVNKTTQSSVNCTGPYNDDCFEFYLDMGNEKASSYDSNDDHIAFSMATGSNLTCYKNHYNPSFKTSYAAGKYIIEGSFTWAELGKTPVDGLRFGMEAQFNDDDDDAVNDIKRDHKMGWYYPDDVATGNPSTFGTGGLSSTNTGEVDWVVNEDIVTGCAVVLSADTLSFSTAASTKTVTASALGVCGSGVKSVTTSNAWITPTISGNTISIATAANASFLREGDVKVLVSGVEYKVLHVIQDGIPLNKSPQINLPVDHSCVISSGLQTINLTGINDGDNGSQGLTITATSSNPAIIPSVNVNYTSPATTGTLTFTPAPALVGTSIITVTVKDNAGTDGGGVDTKIIQFNVNVTTSDIVIQAEDYTSQSGCASATNQTGYTGLSFMDYGGTNSYVEWKGTVTVAGTYDILITYANGGSSIRPAKLTVNGTDIGTNNFAVTGGWGAWTQYLFSKVSLKVGDNVIRLTSTTTAGINVDKLTLKFNPETSLRSPSSEDGILVYPNPVNDRLNILGLASGEINVFNHAGMKVKTELISGIESVVNLQDLPQGLYLVRLTSNNKVVKTLKIVKR